MDYREVTELSGFSNKQPHIRWRWQFSSLSYCFLLFWWVLDGFLQFKQKQKPVMETDCFLINKRHELKILCRKQNINHIVLWKVLQVHACICSCEFLFEDLCIGLGENILTHAYVWKMERTISCSNARYKPIVSTWSSRTLISLYSRTLWALKNRLIKIIFSSLWQQPRRHYSRQTMDNRQEQD